MKLKDIVKEAKEKGFKRVHDWNKTWDFESFLNTKKADEKDYYIDYYGKTFVIEPSGFLARNYSFLFLGREDS